MNQGQHSNTKAKIFNSPNSKHSDYSNKQIISGLTVFSLMCPLHLGEKSKSKCKSSGGTALVIGRPCVKCKAAQ